MTNDDLDKSYTALCEALTRVGEERAPVFLAMLCLSLISRQASAAEVLALIEQSEAQAPA